MEAKSDEFTAAQPYTSLPLSRIQDAAPIMSGPLPGRTIRVGPANVLKTPSAAAKTAKPGTIIEISADEYKEDLAVWTQDNLTIRGVGGRAHVNAHGKAAEGKAIWVIKGNNVTIENIEFSNCRVPDKNGAGIRFEGVNLVVKNCAFHHNENGILTGERNGSTIKVEYSEFAYNGHGDGYSHGIYIGRIEKFIFNGNYVHHTNSGHHVKSRAKENEISYNRLMDEENGNASYAIDLPNGGLATVIGNTIQQGKNAENWSVINYQDAGTSHSSGLYVISNTVVNERGSGTFVQNKSPIEAQLVNNLIVGKINLCIGPYSEKNNMKIKIDDFKYPETANFHLNNNTKQ